MGEDYEKIKEVIRLKYELKTKLEEQIHKNIMEEIKIDGYKISRRGK